MRPLFVFLIAALCLVGGSAHADRPTVRATEAAQHAGIVATVYGRVIEVRRVDKGPIIFEIEGKPSAPKFRALVYPMAVPRFGSDPENVYLGKVVQVTGQIVIRKDLPQAWISDPSQIKLHEPSPTGTPTPASP
jgi:RecJ-like exonuclease